MAHSLILGMTESGKSTLAKRLAALYKRKNIGVLVLDPLCTDWECDFQTDSVDEFLKMFWDSRQCMAFIDESGDAIGHYGKAMIQTATKGRHWGHSCHYITQRGTMIAPTVRDQCSHLFLFCTSFEDSKIHAQEWNENELKNACALDKGHYYHATRFGQTTKSKLF